MLEGIIGDLFLRHELSPWPPAVESHVRRSSILDTDQRWSANLPNIQAVSDDSRIDIEGEARVTNEELIVIANSLMVSKAPDRLESPN